MNLENEVSKKSVQSAKAFQEDINASIVSRSDTIEIFLDGDEKDRVDKTIQYKNETVNMPAEGRTLVFPRVDNAYKKKESLPFDEF